MQFSNWNAALFTVAFLVPGFMWSTVLSLKIPRRSRASELRIIEFLTLSFLNHALWSWAWIIILRPNVIDTHPYLSAAACFVIVVLSPLALGIVTGLLAHKRPVARFLTRLGYQPLKAIPTAWDYFFAKAQPYWVVAILKDGSRIYGLYGLQSFAGDEPGQRDLYLEGAYRLTNTGDWAPAEDTGGVLIAADQISVLEFRKLTEFNYEQQAE